MTTPSTGSPSSTGINSNIAAVFAYLFGCISGIFLLVVERKDSYVRFHAMQSTVTFLAALFLTMVVSSLPVVGGLLKWLLSVATGVLWLILMFKAFTGERYKLPYIGEMAERQIR